MSEETERKILKSDIFRILESEGVTEIGALYKISPSKFVLAFGSETSRYRDPIPFWRFRNLLVELVLSEMGENELVLSEI